MKIFKLSLKHILFLAFIPSLIFAHDDEFGCAVKDPKGRYREHNVDFQKMVLNVHFEPKIGKVSGDVKYTFIPKQIEVDTLFLDAPDIEVHQVLVDKQPTEFYTNEKGLIIKFNQQLTWDNLHELKIEYTAFPKKGLYFIGWDDKTERRRKQIWTQGQGIDNRHWIPSYDDVNDKLENLEESKIDDDIFIKITNKDSYKKLISDMKNVIGGYLDTLEDTGFDAGDNDHQMALSAAISEACNTAIDL